MVQADIKSIQKKKLSLNFSVFTLKSIEILEDNSHSKYLKIDFVYNSRVDTDLHNIVRKSILSDDIFDYSSLARDICDKYIEYEYIFRIMTPQMLMTRLLEQRKESNE